MFIKIKYLSFFLLVSLVINSCRKKECWETGECPPIHYDFNLDSIKDYFHAEKGSYWIYLNTKTNELDTQICLGFELATFNHRGETERTRHVSIKYQRLFRSVWSSRLKDDINLETNLMYADGFINPDRINESYTKLKRTVPASSTECFFYPFDSNVAAGYVGFVCRYIGVVPEVEVQGKTYKNVVKFNLIKDPTWRQEIEKYTYRIVTYYWVKNVGLIKREAEGYGGNIELVDYNIIK